MQLILLVLLNVWYQFINMVWYLICINEVNKNQVRFFHLYCVPSLEVCGVNMRSRVFSCRNLLGHIDFVIKSSYC
ncbi:hypothetical protein HanPI659440_Chr14g0551631 [Helianthus annuus]|nr:hypothetical protein HanPI659440_Chr14g0551631 [Helianthus annuus]